MTSYQTCNWRATWPCALLALTILQNVSVSGAVQPLRNGTCARVKCPTTDCRRRLDSYRHQCCGKICDCYEAGTRTFHQLSSEWFSSDCRQKCICLTKFNKSFRRVLTTECRPLRCPTTKNGCKTGYGTCCPICKTASSATSCHSTKAGKEFRDGESWQVSPCQRCQCISGRIVCTHKECPHLTCHSDLKPKTLPNECCPSYCRDKNETIRPYQSCNSRHENRTDRHGEKRFPQWPCKPLSCVCRHGDWECDPKSASCSIKCGNNRTVQFGEPGQCCPVCVGVKACHVGDGHYRSAGTVWTDKSSTRQCGCIHGVVECLSLSSSKRTASTVQPPEEVHHNASMTWIIVLTIVLAVSAVFLVLGLLIYWVSRRHPATWRLINIHLGWHRPHRFASSNGNAAKGVSSTMHYKKHNEDEVMFANQVDENSNQRTEPLLA